jgi:hypothetical protein
MLIYYRLGRRKLMAILFGIAGVFIISLLIPSINIIVHTTSAMIARMTMVGAFATSYVYTPEVCSSIMIME